MIEITTTAAERDRLRDGMGPMFTALDYADQELHDLYVEFFEHNEATQQKAIPAYNAEYIARRLFAIEAVLCDAVREWHAMTAPGTNYRGKEYEVKRARRLLEITEAEELAHDVFMKIERMSTGTAKEKLAAELRRAEALPDADAIPILKTIIEEAEKDA